MEDDRRCCRTTLVGEVGEKKRKPREKAPLLDEVDTLLSLSGIDPAALRREEERRVETRGRGSETNELLDFTPSLPFSLPTSADRNPPTPRTRSTPRRSPLRSYRRSQASKAAKAPRTTGKGCSPAGEASTAFAVVAAAAGVVVARRSTGVAVVGVANTKE